MFLALFLFAFSEYGSTEEATSPGRFNGKLGSSMVLYPSTPNKDFSEATWNKGSKRVGSFKNNVSQPSDLYTYRATIFMNGSLQLNYTQREDSGVYSVELHDKSGKIVHKANITLEIMAPVSQPVVKHTCLPHGEVIVTCWAEEGDRPSYTWALDGKALNESVAYLSDEDNIIILKQSVSGNLVCTARNGISENYTSHVISACSGFVTPLNCTINDTEIPAFMNTNKEDLDVLKDKRVLISLGGKETLSIICQIKTLYQDSKETLAYKFYAHLALGEVIVIFVMFVVIFCLLHQKTKNDGKQNDEGHELVHTEMTVDRRKATPVSDDGVVYSQIRVSKETEQNTRTSKGDVVLVYATVKKKQKTSQVR
ncbi:uncharacterized protein [Lepisosteus oculatus]|uniref:uncharacterized protein isoform X1 n=1 Tax=Lepisosteus oculatus TaxID=7918 RepID=UPI00073FFF28|nr:PREDICTED: uncharacterized protein LOC107077679 isoform X2 [Lepisosteus oculatus]